jgi:hypothetical protein
MKDPVSVSLIRCPHIAFLFRVLPASGICAVRSIRAQKLPFSLFHALSDVHKHFLHSLTNSGDKIPSVNYILHKTTNSSFLKK